VVRRAANLLTSLEKQRGAAGAPLTTLPLFAASASAPDPPEPDPLAAAVAGLEPDQMTPRQALEALYRLKSLLPVSDTAAS
jgi:DNA mismatch repair protein MutS